MKQDVIIVGGGPAGLSAALVLGRCRRNVLLYDRDEPRNARSRGVHAYLGLDGVTPIDFRARARAQLARYPGVRLVDGLVTEVLRDHDHVAVTDEHGSRALGRALLLATGLVDELPKVPDADRFYGRGLYTCVFCDGWELRDRPLAVIATAERGVELARSLSVFSDDVVLVVHEGPPLSAAERTELERANVRLLESPVVALRGSATKDGEESLEGLALEDGTLVPCEGAFVGLGQRPASDLAHRLGCDLGSDGRASVHGKQRSAVSRVFVAGDDASDDVQLAIVAAAQGARAGQEIHRFLRAEDEAASGRAAS